MTRIGREVEIERKVKRRGIKRRIKKTDTKTEKIDIKKKTERIDIETGIGREREDTNLVEVGYVFYDSSS